MFDKEISIITASYNYANYISETIESVMSQTYPNWEMIVVDDGSTDNSVEIIKSYCRRDNRIKLFYHENNKNKGLKDTILLGLEHAKSDWIVFLESDDAITPNYLEEKIKIIEQNPNIEFVFNNFDIIGDTSYYKTTKYSDWKKYVAKKSGFISKKFFYNLNNIPTFSLVMMKKYLFETLNFNSPIKPWLDYYLWLQLSKKIDFYFLDKKLTYWRKHNDSYIKKHTNSTFYFWLKVALLGIPKPFFIKLIKMLNITRYYLLNKS